MAHQGHWNRTRPAPTTVMPDLPDAEHWRTTLSAVSLTFGILASAVFVLRVCVARCSSCKIRAEDVIMGVGVVLMWGTIASVLLSELSRPSTLPFRGPTVSFLLLTNHL